MSKQKMTKQEVAILVRSRKILKSRGLARDMDVTAICAEAGISRKTGYLWADKQEQQKQEQELTFDLQQEIENLREENKQLKQKYKQERFENEGRKLAWEIHGVDELLAERKKNTAKRHRKQKR